MRVLIGLYIGGTLFICTALLFCQLRQQKAEGAQQNLQNAKQGLKDAQNQLNAGYLAFREE